MFLIAHIHPTVAVTYVYVKTITSAVDPYAYLFCDCKGKAGLPMSTEKNGLYSRSPLHVDLVIS